MKKYLSILWVGLLMVALSACEDVPAPYEIHKEGGSTTTIFSETFSSSLGKFKNYTTDGGGEWVNDYSTAKASGYDNNTKVTTAGTYYLVSPEIDLTSVDSAYVTYDYIVRYNKGDENQQVLITATFDETDPSAGWTVLNQTHTEGADWSTFYNAAINVPTEFLGKKVRVALRYNTNSTSGSTWEVKNFKVMSGAAPAEEEPEPEPSDNLLDKTFDTSLDPFVNYTTAGEGEWVIDYSTAKATGYDNSTKVTTAGTYYLVSPEIDLAGIESAYVDYSYILMYNKGNENQQLLISASFDENKPTEGWTLLNKEHTVGSSWTVFANSTVTIPAEFLGQKVRIAFYYNTNSTSGSTWEVKSVSIKEGEPEPGPTPGGGSSADKPYTVAQLHALFDAGTIPSDVVYTKGIVSKIDEVNSTTYGNATYYISDDGTTTNQFEVYRGYALGGAKFTSQDQLQVGDEVIVYGNVVEYGTYKTREYTTGSKIYYSSRLGTEGGDTPSGDNSLPYSSSNLKDFSVKTIEGQGWDLGTSYAKATGYNNGSTVASKTWLVSPAINTTVKGSEGAVMTFDYVLRYVSTSTDIKGFHKVLVSTDYDGVVTDATWTVLDFEPIESPTYDWTFYSSNAITIPAEFLNKENVYFAWYFECTTENSTTWELKNLSIKEGSGDTPDDPDEPSDAKTLADFTNGGFESWESDDVPTLWKSTTTASNGTLAKSTDAHSGTYSVQIQGNTSANKRLGSTELLLEAGTYDVKFYAKGDGAAASVRPGYVPVTDGKVGSYVYGEYTNDLSSEEWTEINHQFTLSAKTLVNLVIMNSKNPGANVLIDDYTITKQ